MLDELECAHGQLKSTASTYSSVLKTLPMDNYGIFNMLHLVAKKIENREMA